MKRWQLPFLILLAGPALALASPESESVGEGGTEASTAGTCEEMRALKNAHGGETPDEQLERLRKRFLAFTSAEEVFQDKAKHCEGAATLRRLRQGMDGFRDAFGKAVRLYGETYELARAKIEALDTDSCEAAQKRAVEGLRARRNKAIDTIEALHALRHARENTHNYILERLEHYESLGGEGCTASLAAGYNQLLVLEWYPGCRTTWMMEDLDKLAESLNEQILKAKKRQSECHALAAGPVRNGREVAVPTGRSAGNHSDVTGIGADLARQGALPGGAGETQKVEKPDLARLGGASPFGARDAGSAGIAPSPAVTGTQPSGSGATRDASASSGTTSGAAAPGPSGTATSAAKAGGPSPARATASNPATKPVGSAAVAGSLPCSREMTLNLTTDESLFSVSHNVERNGCALSLATMGGAGEKLLVDLCGNDPAMRVYASIDSTSAHRAAPEPGDCPAGGKNDSEFALVRARAWKIFEAVSKHYELAGEGSSAQAPSSLPALRCTRAELERVLNRCGAAK